MSFEIRKWAVKMTNNTDYEKLEKYTQLNCDYYAKQYEYIKNIIRS